MTTTPVLLYKLTIVTHEEEFTFWSDMNGFKDLCSIRDTHELNPSLVSSNIEVIKVGKDVADLLLM